LVIIARTPNALDEMFLTLEKEARDAGLIVNQTKTKYMKTAREKEKITQQYIIGQNQFASINEFTYLGAQINTQNKISEEIRKRIQAGNRYDLPTQSCVNTEVKLYNKRLQNIVSASNHARVHSMSTERRHHTQHGLHFNKKGREWIVNNIIKEIRNWKSSYRVSSPIELPWKNEMKDLGNQVSPVIVSVEKEGPNPNCKNDHFESEDSAAKVVSLFLSRTGVECMVQTTKLDDGQQEEITLRKSTRLKQLPSNKYQDFLY